MDIILIFSFSLSLFIFIFLFCKSTRNMRRLPERKQNAYLNLRFFKCIILSCIIFVITYGIIPRLIWTFSDKSISYSNRIDERKRIYALQDIPGNYLMANITSGNEDLCVVQLEGNDNTAPKVFHTNAIKLHITDIGEPAKYEREVTFKRVKLKSNNLLAWLINRQFATNNLDSHESFSSEKVHLYIPYGSTTTNYVLKN